MASTLDRSLASLLKSLEAVLPPKDALLAFRKAVDHAVANVSNSAVGAKPDRAATAKHVKSKSVRGPKPGGRQLKAHVGKKAFDALDPDVKDKARRAITGAAAKWATMTMDERSKILSPILRKRGVTVDLGKLGGKVEGE